jgi:leader peptidase (prepilin peptidase)/N-methyltransferase
MNIAMVLAFVGLGLGSFVNALVWRLYMQEQASNAAPGHGQSSKADKTSPSKVKAAKAAKTSTGALHKAHKKSPALSTPSGEALSIMRGRSMCPHCHHRLGPLDLVPLLSWLALNGKCRYCEQPIGVQYPLVEVMTAVVFAVTYLAWPYGFDRAGLVRLIIWLAVIVGFMALTVYDLRWMILPNRVVYPLVVIGVAFVLIQALLLGGGPGAVREGVLGLAVGGGIFYGLFRLSGGRWIGGGDVKLGFVYGLLLGGPLMSLLVLFLSSLLGTAYILPLMLAGRLGRHSRVPFGPFLMLASWLVLLWGARIADWYMTITGLR